MRYEPLSNLDAQVRATTRAELKELQRREAMTLADRLAVMQHGRFEQIGPPLEVYRRPATLFVAQFLSAPRLNLLEGDVVAGAVRTPVGVRPEWLRLGFEPVEGSPPLAVTLVEPLGAELLVHARGNGVDLVARVAAEAFAEAVGRVWLDGRASRADLFDEQGRRLPG